MIALVVSLFLESLARCAGLWRGYGDGADRGARLELCLDVVLVQEVKADVSVDFRAAKAQFPRTWWRRKKRV